MARDDLGGIIGVAGAVAGRGDCDDETRQRIDRHEHDDKLPPNPFEPR